MMEIFERIAFDIERNLKDVTTAFRTYAALFVFAIVVFGFYGIMPLGAAIKEKLSTINEMSARYEVMQKNLVDLEQASKDLANNLELIVYLNRFMPEETATQTYMLDFIQAVGAENFVVKSFTQNERGKTSGQVDLSINLEGINYPTELIKQIEVLKRVTQVKKVSVYKSNQGTMNINLILTIYNIIT